VAGKKGPDISSEKIQESMGLVNNFNRGFISCPFGSRAPRKEDVNCDGGQGNIVPRCSIHGNDCPGLKKINQE